MRIKELRAENERLRAALAHSDQPCAYCSLPADEWNKCVSGFPGCGRADDAMGCPHLGDGMATVFLAAVNAELLAALKAMVMEVKPFRPVFAELVVSAELAIARAESGTASDAP